MRRLFGYLRLELGSVGGNELLENAIVVAQAIPPEWELLGRRRVHIARSESAKAPIAQASITLVFKEVFEVLQKTLYLINNK